MDIYSKGCMERSGVANTDDMVCTGGIGCFIPTSMGCRVIMGSIYLWLCERTSILGDKVDTGTKGVKYEVET